MISEAGKMISGAWKMIDKHASVERSGAFLDLQELTLRRPGGYNQVDVTETKPAYYESIVVGIGATCNLRCVYCHQSRPDFDPGPDLDLKGFEKVVDFCRSAKGAVLDLTGGGETTIVPGWQKTSLSLLESGLKLQMTTNLSKVYTAEEIDALSRFKILTVSIDTFDPAHFRKIRRKGDLRTIIFNLARLRAAAMKRCVEPPQIIWAAVIAADTVFHLEELVTAAAACQVNALQIADLREWSDIPEDIAVRHIGRLPKETLQDAFEHVQRSIELAKMLKLEMRVQPNLFKTFKDAIAGRLQMDASAYNITGKASRSPATESSEDKESKLSVEPAVASDADSEERDLSVEPAVAPDADSEEHDLSVEAAVAPDADSEERNLSVELAVAPDADSDPSSIPAAPELSATPVIDPPMVGGSDNQISADAVPVESDNSRLVPYQSKNTPNRTRSSKPRDAGYYGKVNVWNVDVPKGQTRLCFDPWSFMQVTSAGNLRPCCFSIRNLGNIYDDKVDIVDIVNGEYARQMRRGLLTGELVEDCANCYSRPLVDVAEFHRQFIDFVDPKETLYTAERNNEMPGATRIAARMLDRIMKSADLSGGRPRTSSNSHRAVALFDGDESTFWISAEMGANVKDQAWIGYEFLEPTAVARVMLNQPANVAYRQDLVSIESSVDEGQNWIQHILVELDKSDRLSCIDVPSPRPAKLWRVVARGYNASAEERAWTPIGVDFFVTLESSLQQSRMRFETEAEARTLPGSRVPVPPSAEKLVPATLRADHVIGSSTPERLGLLVDGSLETFWVSGESGQSVRDHAWIGYQFAAPASVGEIVLLQTNVHEYRQDKVAVETRNSPDEDWCRIADFDLVAGAVESKMRIFSPHQATTWRIVACGENATAPSHRWTPLGIGLKLREESPALKTRLARAVGAMRRGMSHSF